MTALHDALGIVTRTGEAYQVLFERRIAKPVEKVWAAITIPERLADWLADAEVDLWIGGHFRLRFEANGYVMEGRIVALEPLRRLAWTWPDPDHPDSVVSFDLEPDGAGCRLTLTQTGLPSEHLRSVTGGWHTHLAGLEGATDGVRTAWSQDREDEILKHYAPSLPV